MPKCKVQNTGKCTACSSSTSRIDTIPANVSRSLSTIAKVRDLHFCIKSCCISTNRWASSSGYGCGTDIMVSAMSRLLAAWWISKISVCCRGRNNKRDVSTLYCIHPREWGQVIGWVLSPLRRNPKWRSNTRFTRSYFMHTKWQIMLNPTHTGMTITWHISESVSRFGIGNNIFSEAPKRPLTVTRLNFAVSSLIHSTVTVVTVMVGFKNGLHMIAW